MVTFLTVSMDSYNRSENGTWSGYTPTERAAPGPQECIDRPVWLAAVTLCQLLNPADYVHLNHALAIGSTIPVLPIDESRVEILNKFIDVVWGERVTLIIPVVLTQREIPGRQPHLGLVHPKVPVPGLRVVTRQVIVDSGEVIEEVVGQIKSEYKHQGPIECITSGCDLLLSSIMGNLVIQPNRPSRVNHQDHHDWSSQVDTIDRGRRRSNSRRNLHGTQRTRSVHRSNSAHYRDQSKGQGDPATFLTSRLWKKIQGAITH